MAVAARDPHGPTPAELPVEPSLDEVRGLAREHNLVALRHSFIDDLETPVSAFLKLRGRDPQYPAFLLESAEQGQRVGRFSFIGVRPRKVVRWSLSDGGDPYALAAAEVGAFSQAPLPRGAAVRGRRGRLLRLRPRAHRRAARRPQPRRRRAAGHGADALRRARGLRPPQAHDHDPRERLRRRRRPRRRLRRRAGDDPEGAPPAGRARARGRADAVARRGRPSCPTCRAGSSRRWSRASSSTCTPATPSRSSPPSAGAPSSTPTRSRSTAACGWSTRARTCTSWTSWTSRSPAPRPSRC